MIIFSQRGLTDYTATSCEGCPLMMHFDVSVPASPAHVKSRPLQFWECQRLHRRGKRSSTQAPSSNKRRKSHYEEII